MPTPSIPSVAPSMAPSVTPSVEPTSRSQRQQWWHALRALNVDRVQALLDAGVRPDMVHADGYTALGWLATTAVPQIGPDVVLSLIERLIAAGADPGRPESSDGWIKRPSEQGIGPTGAYLGAYVNRPEFNDQDPPVILALQRRVGHLDLARALVRATTWSSDPSDTLALQALSLAITAWPASEITCDLLTAGVNPNMVWKSFKNASKARSALAWSLLLGTPATTHALLNAGATLSSREHERRDDPYLLALGTQLRTAPMGSPSEARVDQDLRRREQLVQLLDRDVPMNDAARQRIIPLAVTHAQLDVPLLDRLHAQGASWHGTLRDGQTALHMAMERSRTDGNTPALIEHLLTQGLDLNAPDTAGVTPLERLRRRAGGSASLQPLLAHLEGHVLRQTMNADRSRTPTSQAPLESPRFHRPRL